MSIEPRGYLGYGFAGFASLLPSDGAVGHSLLQRFVNVGIIPRQIFKVGIFFFLTNDYNLYILVYKPKQLANQPSGQPASSYDTH